MASAVLVLFVILSVGSTDRSARAEPPVPGGHGLLTPEVGESSVRSLAEGGDPNAQWLLARELLDSGSGADKEADGLFWLRRAAEQGHSLAQRDLGIRFELGQGLRKDLVEAFFWYALASRRDSGRAQARREALRPDLTQEELDAVTARLRDWHPITGAGP